MSQEASDAHDGGRESGASGPLTLFQSLGELELSGRDVMVPQVLMSRAAWRRDLHPGDEDDDDRNRDAGMDVPDIIGPADSMKPLFRLPYSSEGVSLAFHRIGRVLVVDDHLDELFGAAKDDPVATGVYRDDHPHAREQHQERRPADGPSPIPSPCPSAPSSRSSTPQPPGHVHSAQTDVHADADTRTPPRAHTRAPEPKDGEGDRGVDSGEAVGMQEGGVGGDVKGDDGRSRGRMAPEPSSGSNTTSLAPSFISATSTAESPPAPSSLITPHTMRARKHQGYITPRFTAPPPPFQLPPAPRAFPHLLNFQLHDLRMLMGTELRVFSNDEHPAVTALFQDADKGLELVSCLDAYLDNIFASIPELAYCMLSKGYIQSWKLLRTEDIPYLTHVDADGPVVGPKRGPGGGSASLFDPKMIEINATTLLQFLKENCRNDGSTYLLHRDEGDKTVQLYDVTAMCAHNQKRWRWLLAMLSYRFAMRIYQQAPLFGRKLRAQLHHRHRALLQTCLGLLRDLTAMSTDGAAGQHESLCASVQEKIADSYLLHVGHGHHHHNHTHTHSYGDGLSVGGGAEKNGATHTTHDSPPSPSSPRSGPNASRSGRHHDHVQKQQHAPARKEKKGPKGTGSKGVDGVFPASPTRATHAHAAGKRSRVAESDLCMAHDHLVEGISILRPLLLSQTTDDSPTSPSSTNDASSDVGFDEDDDDDEISFGSFASDKRSSPPRSSPSSGGGGGGDAHHEGFSTANSSNGGGSGVGGTSSSHSRKGPNMAAVMVLEQMMGLRKKLVATLRQLLEVYMRKHDATGVMSAVKRAVDEMADAATLAGLHTGPYIHPPHSSSSRSPKLSEADQLKLRVRCWIQETSCELWGVCGDLARALAMEPTRWGHTAEAAESEVINWLAEVEEGLKQAGGAPQLLPQSSPTAPPRSLSTAPLISLALLYLQPHRPTVVLLESYTHSAVFDAGGPRATKLLLVASALCYARAAKDGRTDAMRRLGDACNEVGKSLRGSMLALCQDVERVRSCGGRGGGGGDTGGGEGDGGDADGGGSSSSSSITGVGDGVGGGNGSVEKAGVSQGEEGTTGAAAPRDQLLTTQQAQSPSPAEQPEPQPTTAPHDPSSIEPPSPSQSSAASPPPGASKSAAAASAPAALLCMTSAGWWFDRGVEVFSAVHDQGNVATLLLNLAGLEKVWANAGHEPDGEHPTRKVDAKSHLQRALGYCTRAHEALGDRQQDPKCWDQISEEMAMCYLMSGVTQRKAVLGRVTQQQQDSATPFLNAQPISAGDERSIVEPLERALQLYKTLSNHKQLAAVHYQLGSFYSRIWMAQADKKRARLKLGQALTHYNEASGALALATPSPSPPPPRTQQPHTPTGPSTDTHPQPTTNSSTTTNTSNSGSSTSTGVVNDPLAALIVLDLTQLYLAVDAAGGGATDSEPVCLVQALECMLKSRRTLAGSGTSPQHHEQIKKNLSKTLLGLVKHYTSSGDGAMSLSTSGSQKLAKYRTMYRHVLGAKAPLLDVLEELWGLYNTK